MNELYPETPQTCPKVTKHTAAVNLPVCITPFAIASPAKVKCCGDVTVVPTCNVCIDSSPNTCEFIVTQKIQVDLPIEFGATVKVGETFVDCDCLPCGDHHCHPHDEKAIED